MKQRNKEKFRRTTRRRWVALMCGLCMLLPIMLSAQTDITDAFTDAKFKALVYKKLGKTAPEPIYDTDVNKFTRMDIEYYIKVSDLAGIEYFTGLKILDCSGNKLTALDVSKNTALMGLSCYQNELTALDVSKNTNLCFVVCSSNELSVDALNALLKSLHGNKFKESKKMYMSDNPGIDNCNISITEGKGWLMKLADWAR
jgi:Leucine-rich repeat (LRR) protein